MPDMTYVDSSNVEQIGYDANSRELHVYFVSGDQYIYENVPQEMFDRFMNAASKGSFLNRELKPAGYAYRKI